MTQKTSRTTVSLVKKSDSKCESDLRSVLRRLDSHKKPNEVGVHWLRVSVFSFETKLLCSFVSTFFGESHRSDNGFWGYDSSYEFENNVRILFDSDIEVNRQKHKGKITLECPGKALDALGCDDLVLFMQGLGNSFNATCSRIDTYFDDYNRITSIRQIVKIVQKKDFTGFREVWDRSYGYNKDGLRVDMVTFGHRGKMSSGKHLRIYDKGLETKDLTPKFKKDCIRYEAEWTKYKAQEVFKRLSQCKSIRAFGTICSGLVGGAICFIKRTGDKNLDRLDVYSFWQQILDQLGEVVVRVKVDVNTLEGVQKWIEEQVSGSLACMSESFESDYDFISWIQHIVNNKRDNLSKAHKIMLAGQKQKRSYTLHPMEVIGV